MHRRVYSFLNIDNILSVHQFGVKKGVNTSDALAEFADIVHSSINKDNL